MPTREFRTEFLREQRNKGWINKKYIHDNNGCPHFEVVFKDSADGKYYAMEYYDDTDHGIDTFDGDSDDRLYLCYEVEKEEVVAISWVKKS